MPGYVYRDTLVAGLSIAIQKAVGLNLEQVWTDAIVHMACSTHAQSVNKGLTRVATVVHVHQR